MRIITQYDKLEINRLYKELGTYAAVSRATGFAPSTVKKYVDKNFEDVDTTQLIRFEGRLPEFDATKFRGDDWGHLCELSDEEVKEIVELWKEIEF